MQRAETRRDQAGGVTTGVRNATLNDLAEVLKDQHARKVDVVAPATAIRSSGALLTVADTETILTDDGVTLAAGTYRPTEVADEGVAGKLGIPVGFLKRLRAERPDLYDANVNGLLRGKVRRRGGETEVIAPRDPRSFLVRAFRSDDGGVGVARAFLSDRYRIVDNLDVLVAALDGVRQSGAEVDVRSCDLTDRRMYVRVEAPAVRAMAPTLLAGYRSPFSGAEGADNPVVFAGFVLSNSETGSGAFTITPRLTVQVCDNGMTINQDALRNVHLGGKLDEGLIVWSEETQQANLRLITSQARDAVATFLDGDYLEAKVAAIEAEAGAPVEDAADTVKRVAKALKFGEDASDEILSHFIRGGQPTAGGVMQAVTSWAQTLPDADRAADAEGQALAALTLAAS